ncbi:ATP-binding protein [Pseudoalteromonas sp. MMG022]|uniref:hybrid sensor histidine kinase/response regulator n=1 Tax=Pseudoalteromonas sp. MMG022 TaxID=2909978 RepID=UPI001F168435|nr:ATP-binding protein [Pseudoalteromonas sp. MMG022]MCF6436835.1 ATP-binding protein [Pseudoalteromonas sp. MMG022]
MDDNQEFIPLKKYRRAALTGLLISIIVASFLCLHLYHIKLNRAFNEHRAYFDAIDTQVVQKVAEASNVIDNIFISLDQPLAYEYDQTILRAIQKSDNYYHKLDNDAGEIVARKNGKQPVTVPQNWQQILALGPAFNTALALVPPLDAIGYVKEGQFAFVRRKDTSTSHLLSAMLDGALAPDFSLYNFSTSGRVTIKGRHYFSIAKQSGSARGEYVVLVYDSEDVATWLTDITSAHVQISLINKDKRNLLSDELIQLKPKHQVNQFEPWQGGVQLYTLRSQSPIDLVYEQDEAQFLKPVLFEVLLEFGFLSLFVIATYILLSWLSNRIFIRPVSYFVSYLTHQDHAPQNTFDYVVPVDWQPWFAKVKQVVMQKQSLLEQLQEHNEMLDEQVKLQQRALSRSLEAKERQAALLNTVLDSVPDLIYFNNIDGSFIGCNRAFEQFLGIEKSQLVGRELADVTNEYPQLLTLEQQMRDERRSITQTIVLDHQSYMLTVSPLLDIHRGLLGSLGVARDVTEQQQAMKALQTSEENFKSAMEYAPNGVILVSLDKSVLVINKAAKRYLSSEDPEPNVHLSSLFNSDNYLAISHILSMLLQDNKHVLELSLSQGEPLYWLQLSASLVWDKNKEPKYFVLHLQDITSLTQARLDAERATLAKSRFIANISHEIRTPLNVIQGVIDIVKKQGVSERQSNLLGQVQHASEQLLSMLNSILSFAKVEGQHQELSFAPFCIATLIKDCQDLILPLSEQKQLQLDLKVDERIWPTLKNDENKIKQVLLNLLNNAVKYTPTGTITLSLKIVSDTNSEQSIRFSVQDTGVGIKQEDQQRLFDAFTQGDESPARRHEGIGLGLAIVKHEVSKLGGEIALISEPEQGSEFYFTLTLDKVRNEVPQRVMHTLWLCSSRRVTEYMNKPYIDVVHEMQEVFAKLEEQHFDCLIISASDDALTILNSKHTALKSLKHIVIPESVAVAPLQPCPQVTSLSEAIFLQSAYCFLFTHGSETKHLQLPNKKVSGSLCLVVDDNHLNLSITANMLQTLSVNVAIQASAESLLEAVTLLQPDLILMDIHMPEIDGYQATQEIRTKLRNFGKPIIALTANSSLGEKDHALSVGMNDYLTKPLSQAKLLETLQIHLNCEGVFFDQEMGLRQMMGNAELLNKMLEKFAAMCTEYLQRIDTLNDDNQLQMLAHNIKGAAGGIGFTNLSMAAKSLELHIKEAGTLQHLDFKDALKVHLQQVRQFILMRYKGE